MINIVRLELSTARNAAVITGRGMLVSAWLESASVTPQLIITDPAGVARSVSITLPINYAAAFNELAVTNAAGAGILWLLIGDNECEAVNIAGGAASSILDRFTDVFWGPHEAVAAGGGLPVGWHSRAGFFGSAASQPFWTTQVAGAGLVPVANVRNIRCAQLRPNGGQSAVRFALTDMPWARVRTEAGAGGGVFTARSDTRIQSWNYELYLRKEAAGIKAGLLQGAYFLPAGAVSPALPGSGNGAHFGLNYAGGWRFTARAVGAGALTINEYLTWPAAVTDWVRVRFQIVDADPIAGRDGIVRLHLNDTQVKEYRDMSLFPSTWNSGGAGTETGYAFSIVDDGVSTDTLYFAKTGVFSGKGEGIAQA